MREFSFKSGDGFVYGKMAFPEGEGPWPVVVFSHGFGASHVYDSGMEQRFTCCGLGFVAFDFRGGGPESLSSGTMREMSVLTEADDLMAVMDELKRMDEVDPTRIFLMGSSQGGYVSAYVAALRPADVAGLVLFFPAFNIGDDTRARIARRGGATPDEVKVGPHTVGRRYEEDALSVDILDCIRGYDGNVLLLHGALDDIVPLDYSRRAANAYGEKCRFVVQDGLGHGFRSSPKELHDEAMSQALDFITGLIAL